MYFNVPAQMGIFKAQVRVIDADGDDQHVNMDLDYKLTFDQFTSKMLRENGVDFTKIEYQDPANSTWHETSMLIGNWNIVLDLARSGVELRVYKARPKITIYLNDDELRTLNGTNILNQVVELDVRHVQPGDYYAIPVTQETPNIDGGGQDSDSEDETWLYNINASRTGAMTDAELATQYLTEVADSDYFAPTAGQQAQVSQPSNWSEPQPEFGGSSNYTRDVYDDYDDNVPEWASGYRPPPTQQTQRTQQQRDVYDDYDDTIPEWASVWRPPPTQRSTGGNTRQ